MAYVQTENIDIFKRASTCRTLFRQSLEKNSAGIDDSSQLNDQYQRFTRWAEHLGAMAAPQLSLDKRLQHVPDIRDWVLELLDLLEVNLNDYIKACLTLDQPPFYQNLTLGLEVDERSPLARVALEGIQQSIDRLHWLGNAIRKSSTAQLVSRVSKFASKQVDEEEFVERMTRLMVRGRYPEITEAFSEHLVKSISFRRQRLLHQKKRQKVLAEPRQFLSESYYESSPLAADKATRSQEGTFPGNSTDQAKDPSRQEVPGQNAESSVKPSTINKSQFRVNLYEQTPRDRTTGSQAPTSIAHDMPYPKEPEWSHEQSHYQCQWCFQDIAYTKDKSEWPRAWRYDVSQMTENFSETVLTCPRSHFKEDLQPYICVSEDCSEQLQYFGSLRKWREHMDIVHSPDWTKEVFKQNVWYCTSDQHGFKTKDSPSQLRQHLKEMHHELGDDEREIMVSCNVIPKPRGSAECPFCHHTIVRDQASASATAVSNITVDGPPGQRRTKGKRKVKFQQPTKHIDSDIEDTDDILHQASDDKNSQGKSHHDDKFQRLNLSKHIAQHLESLAFVSLRYIDDKTSSPQSGEDFLGAEKSTTDDEEQTSRGLGSDESLTFEDPGPQQYLLDRRWEDAQILESQEIIVDSPHAQEAPQPPPDRFETSTLHQVPETDVENAILKIIEDNLQVSKMDDQQYLPYGKFEAIFSSQTVALLMNANASKLAGEPQQRHSQIMGSGGKSFRRILATLVMVQQVSYIESFIDEEIGDAEVPIRRSEGGVVQGFTTRHNTTIIGFFQDWSRSSAELFFLYQRMFFVPFFDIRENQLCSYEFGAEVRLPWQHYEAKASGGHGLIHKVQIHPEHLRFRSPSAHSQYSGHKYIEGDETVREPLYFALKEIFKLDRKAHRQELHAMERSLGQKQSEMHLIKTLLTFQHGERCYLLFEWADGNLEEFWESHKADVMSDSWALKQCLGVATALRSIHGTSTWQLEERKKLALETDGRAQREWGRHGDIKPRNILWFKSYGDEHHHLVISDLGLTQFHSELTKSAVPTSRIDGFTEAYRAPEIDLGRNISQSYDIWSLGCVLLEFCLWYVIDADAIRKFEDGRLEEDQSDVPGLVESKFFNINGGPGEREAFLKPVVQETIRELRESKKCTPLIKEILQILQDDMLRIEPKDRSTISEICRCLQDVKRSMTKDDALPSQKAEAQILLPTPRADAEVIDETLNNSPKLDVPQREVDLSFVHGGPDSSMLDTARINPRHRALSIRSESAESDRIESTESEGESYDGSTETNINTAADHSVHPPGLPQDSPEARRLFRSPAVREHNVTKEERDLPRMQSTVTRTEAPTLNYTMLDASSSSMTTALDVEAVLREGYSAESQHQVSSQMQNDDTRPLLQRKSSSANLN